MTRLASWIERFERLAVGTLMVLLVVLGLELLDTFRVSFRDHRFKVEVILFVAMIAVGQHIVRLDGHQIDGTTLLGLGGIMLALPASYYLVRRAPQGS